MCISYTSCGHHTHTCFEYWFVESISHTWLIAPFPSLNFLINKSYQVHPLWNYRYFSSWKSTLPRMEEKEEEKMNQKPGLFSVELRFEKSRQPKVETSKFSLDQFQRSEPMFSVFCLGKIWHVRTYCFVQLLFYTFTVFQTQAIPQKKLCRYSFAVDYGWLSW